MTRGLNGENCENVFGSVCEKAVVAMDLSFA